MTLSTAWRIARRDLHLGFRGLRLLFVCLFLGVTTLAAIGSLTASITGELAARGQTLLGGDIEVAMTQREASAAEQAELRTLGRFSETIRLRAMAQLPNAPADGPAAVLSELKGVDGAYPLYGTLTLKPLRSLRAGSSEAENPGREAVLDGRSSARSKPVELNGVGYRPLPADRILVGQSLVDRLGVRPGGRLRYGTADFTIVGVIADEPDRVGEGFTLGPVAIVSMQGLRRTGLIQPGSLFTSKYRVRLPVGTDARAVRDRLKQAHAAAGWELKDRDRAAPGANRFFEQMGQFLALIGLTALVVAGIGVRNGVASYLTLKRGSIATLKVLGATAADIERIYLLQIAAVGAAAVAAGLAVGALLPPALVALAGDALPVQPGFSLHPLPLALSAAYGILIAAIFTLPPLARVRTEPAAAMFRAGVEQRRRLDRRSTAIVMLATVALIALAVSSAGEPLFAAAVLGATAAVLLLLLALGWLVGVIASRVPRPRRPLWRLALANLYRPGAQTSALVVALGLALTLFVTLAAVQTSLSAEITRTVPKKAPNLFVLDIAKPEGDRFRQLVSREAPKATLNIVPVLRGTIVGYRGTRVAELKRLPEGAWFLRGERGVTYSDVLPQGSDLTAGKWWPREYAGPPLLSLDEKAAAVLNLKVGDPMTVSVLGREVTARIASLRKVNWETMGFNYVLVFSPNTFASAPHTLSATITMPPARDGAVTRAILAALPGASVIPVGEVIGQVSSILDQVAGAIVAAASIAILAGIAVLIGAIAASRQTRAYDSVILKTLGATRWQVLGTQALEYGLLAAVLAAVALPLGAGAAWYVIVQVFDFGWAPDWGVVLGTLGGGALVTLGIGLAGSLPLMSVRPARALRTL